MYKNYIFILTLTLVLILSGCTQPLETEVPSGTSAALQEIFPSTVPNEQIGLDIGPYQVMLMDISDSSGNILHNIPWCDLQDEAYKDYIAPNTATVRIDGITYAGELNYTNWPRYYKQPQFVYRDEKEKIEFQYNADGRLVGYYALHTTAGDGIVTEDECIARAQAFLAEYVHINPMEYAVEILPQAEWEEPGKYIHVRFTKYIDGLPSTDGAAFTFLQDGQLRGYSGYEPDSIPKDSKNPFETEAIEASLISSLYEKYATLPFEYTELKISKDPHFETEFTILKDGRPALIIYIGVEYSTPGPGDSFIGNGCAYRFVIAEDNAT